MNRFGKPAKETPLSQVRACLITLSSIFKGIIYILLQLLFTLLDPLQKHLRLKRWGSLLRWVFAYKSISLHRNAKLLHGQAPCHICLFISST